MNNPSITTRIPCDEAYVALLGKAIYLFAYYEWTIIWIAEKLKNGFIEKYNRGKKAMTSGSVRTELESILRHQQGTVNPFHQDLQNCLLAFSDLIEKRNALIHAHPGIDKSGSHLLIFQSSPTKTIVDMSWPPSEIIAIIQEIDNAHLTASDILHRLP